MSQTSEFFKIQFKSGRNATLTAGPYFRAIASGSDDAKFFAISALRINAARPETLCQQLAVESCGTETALCVADILDGYAGWSQDEAEELRQFLEKNTDFTSWLRSTFANLENGIQNSPVFESNLVQNDFDLNKPNADMLLRAIVLKSALKPDAMQILRRKFFNKS